MSSGIESSGIDDESSTSTRMFSRGLPSFLEPRDPSIVNPFMRPRPTHGTNLCHLFEEECSRIEEQQHFKVYLRVKSINTEFTDIYHLESDTTLKSVQQHVGGKKLSKESVLYKFTHIFNKSNQVTVFNKIIKNNLKEYIFNGQDFTLMTYGASGSGKTYSLMGNGTQPGIIPRCLEFLFQQVNTEIQPRYKPDDKDELISLNVHQQAAEVKKIRGIVTKCKDTTLEANNLTQYRRMSTALSRASQDWRKANELKMVNTYCEVWVSFAEIYNEFIHDLLEESSGKDPPTRLKLIQPPDHKPYIKGLNWVYVRSGMEAYSVLTRGKSRLRYANTNVNATSSRSHCIFTMKLIMYHYGTKTSKISSFRLCDLAGLERAKMTENRGERLNESKRINSSLHVLEKCLQALKTKQHGQQALPPYRESKLTALLQNALSGKENVTMLVTINPEKKFFDETQHVLKFSALAQQLLTDVQSKSELQMSKNYSNITSHNNSSLSHESYLKTLERRERDLEQRELYADDREAELERLEAELAIISEEWEDKEKRIRADVAAKYMNIQNKIYADSDIRFKQEKQILEEEHNLQIDIWRSHCRELENTIKKLQQQNKHLTADVQELEATLKKVTKENLEKSIKRSESCNAEISNVTQDITGDSRCFGHISEIGNNCAEECDDFMKDFAEIDVSKDKSVFDKTVTQINETVTVTPVKIDDVSTKENSSHPAETSDVKDTNDYKSCHKQNDILEVSNVFKQVDKSKSLHFDATETSLNVKGDGSIVQNNTDKKDDVKREDIVWIIDAVHQCSIGNKDESEVNCDKQMLAMDTKENDITRNGAVSSPDSDYGSAADNIPTTTNERERSSDATTLESECNAVFLMNNNINKYPHEIETKVMTEVPKSSDNKERPKTHKQLRSRKGKPDDLHNSYEKSASVTVSNTSTEFESASDSLHSSGETKTSNNSLSKCSELQDKTCSIKSVEEKNEESNGPRTRKQLKLRKTKHEINNVPNGDDNIPSPENKNKVEIKIIESEDCNKSEKEAKNNVYFDTENSKSDILKNVNYNLDPNRGLPLPDSYYTAKKDKKASELSKENCQSLCLSSRRKLFSRRQMDELAAEPQPPPQSAKCLFFGIGDDTSSPDPSKPLEVPRLYTYHRPVRATRQKKK